MLDLPTVSDTAAVTARCLRRRYGDLVAVDGVDLCLEPGEIHALVGLNGAGKTTVMRLLLGMARPDAGTVTLHGRDLARCRPADWA